MPQQNVHCVAVPNTVHKNHYSSEFLSYFSEIKYVRGDYLIALHLNCAESQGHFLWVVKDCDGWATVSLTLWPI